MRYHSKQLLYSALAVLVLCALLSVACSWDIITRGEVHKEDGTSLPDLESVESPAVSEIPLTGCVDDLPDSLAFRIFNMLTIGHTTYCFVEMEVGELLEGVGADPDTILVDHTPQ